MQQQQQQQQPPHSLPIAEPSPHTSQLPTQQMQVSAAQATPTPHPYQLMMPQIPSHLPQQMPTQMPPGMQQDGQYYSMPSQTASSQYGHPPQPSGPSAMPPSSAPYIRPQQCAPHMAMHMYSQQMHPGSMYGQIPMTQYPMHPLHMQSGMAMPPYMGIPHYIDAHTGMAMYPGMTPHQMGSDADLVLQSTNRPVNKRWVLEPEDVLLLERIFALEKCPGRELCQELATRLKVRPRQVQVWFQNRRQRTKGAKGKDGSEDGAPDASAGLTEWANNSGRNDSGRRSDLLIKQLLNGSYQSNSQPDAGAPEANDSQNKSASGDRIDLESVSKKDSVGEPDRSSDRKAQNEQSEADDTDSKTSATHPKSDEAGTELNGVFGNGASEAQQS
ncbi:hypothetical protein AB1Y20_016088 [Prymnesium parvum]|uniref:Homeobox domain-containing protein n=1 Tax=Prymnesium parvum TaxID=97485 RepID=A0AB34K234_PRYPA